MIRLVQGLERAVTVFGVVVAFALAGLSIGAPQRVDISKIPPPHRHTQVIT